VICRSSCRASSWARSDAMHVCVVSFKECWQDAGGRWCSSGGFPQQMAALGNLFGAMTLVVVRVAPCAGGMPLPEGARVVSMRRPAGYGWRRKMSVLARLPEYIGTMLPHLRSADVAHAPLPGDLSLVGLAVALILRKKVVARFAGSWESTSETTFMDRVTRGGMRLLAGGRRVMLATGMGSSAPAPNMSWVASTAISQSDIALVKPDCDRTVGRPLRLAYAGRLAPEKGVEDLIEAIALLKENGMAPNLTVFGDGPLRESLSDLARRRGCADLVAFEGQVGRPDLLRALLKTDLCVLPSLSESFCKARLDAMLCGVPVVTTPVGFGRDIVGQDGERGWLVPAHDPGAIAERLYILAAQDLDYAAIRRRCRAFAERRTVEEWALAIGEHCARQWNLALVGGKLCP
jgi:glycosyltransferase involved in cell wall biosynthesis